MSVLRRPSLLAVGLLAAVSGSSFADTIYDNSVNDLNQRFDPGTLEVGDEILLAGSARYLTNFAFSFWGTNTANPGTFSGNVQCRVVFYLNDGTPFHTYPTPNTVFYDSGFFPIPPTARATLEFTAGADFPAGGLYMPVVSDMTWSVQFQGMGPTDSAGVDLFSPPVVGGYYRDYWQRDPVLGWQLMTNSLSTMDFAARFMATTAPAPRPTLTLAQVGTEAVVYWPTSAVGFVLETSASVDPAALWSALTNDIYTAGTNFVRTNSLGSDPAFFRLKK